MASFDLAFLSVKQARLTGIHAPACCYPFESKAQKTNPAVLSSNVHASAGGMELPSSGSGGGVAVAALPTSGVKDGGEGGVRVEGAVDVDAMMEGQRLLRLELEDAKKRTEKAKRGRKAAEKVGE